MKRVEGRVGSLVFLSANRRLAERKALMYEPHVKPNHAPAHPDEDKLQRQHSGEQGPGGDREGQETLGDQGTGGYGQDSQQGYDPDTGRPLDPGSNWLAFEGMGHEDVATPGDSAGIYFGFEDREDNGQSGPTKDSGGLGFGDEEGLGRTGLSEAGSLGQSDPELTPALEDDEIEDEMLLDTQDRR